MPNKFHYLEYMTELTCIHIYLQKCHTNPQPPGLADYLRGTISLFQYSQKYNYKLLLNTSHPIFNFFEKNDKFTTDHHDIIHEAIPGSNHSSYSSINNSLITFFSSKRSFSVMTNNFYYSSNNNFDNFSDLSVECIQYLRSFLIPNIELSTNITNVFTYLNIEKNIPYTVIHIRCGDAFLNNNDHYDNNLFKHYSNIINGITKNTSEPIILLTDSSIMGKSFKQAYESLSYWDNTKIHIGDLKNSNSNICDTLTDFFILAYSSKIYGTSTSGFSKVASLIYNIPYVPI